MSRFGPTPPPFHYIAYIDEAGDPGIDSVQPNDPNGATEWLSVGATLIRATREAEQVDWIKLIHEEIRSRQGAVFHFRKLSDPRKERACSLVADLPLRCFVVASNKINMEGTGTSWQRLIRALAGGSITGASVCFSSGLPTTSNVIPSQNLASHVT